MRLQTNVRLIRRGVLVYTALLMLACTFEPVAATPQNSASSSASNPNAPANGIPALATELGRISKALDMNSSPTELIELNNSVPPEWTVTTPERSFTIPTGYLRGQLAAGSKENAKAWADHLTNELASYPLTKTTSNANVRAELDRILAGSEFAAVHPPTPWDIFRQRLAAWVQRILFRLLSGMERHPIGGQILFWVFVTFCVGLIAMWVFRFVTSRDRFVAMLPGRVATPSRTWQEWIRAAREAANRSDFREGVHSAYWAGITRMEAIGALPKDPAMTPREYLRLVTEPARDPEGPRLGYREPLSALTVHLERIWYANRKAGSADYLDALRQLEAMGCQLD